MFQSKDIYQEYHDISLPFESTAFSPYVGGFEKCMNKTLMTNYITIDEFIECVNQEDIYNIIRNSITKNKFRCRYEEFKDKLLSLINDYFENNRDSLIKESKKYQKKRFKKRFTPDKVDYCLQVKNFDKEAIKTDIFIPCNVYYYLTIINYIIDFYCSNMVKDITVTEIPFKKV